MDMLQTNNVDLSIAIADSSLHDSPLVYVTPAFERLTGYARDFCVGRNCRFLQPKNGQLSNRLNGHERARIRQFCKRGKEHESMYALMLNEMRSGVPFWNLLYLKHVKLDERPYTVAVQ